MSGVRTIDFSGYTWTVEASQGKVGPGPNYFSDRFEPFLFWPQPLLVTLLCRPAHLNPMDGASAFGLWHVLILI